MSGWGCRWVGMVVDGWVGLWIGGWGCEWVGGVVNGWVGL